jgi:phenylpyruvate tautomerase PptA (4-oxalocrotonate tautomerase family)
MPFINTKVNTKISPEKEQIIKEKLGQAISILGKSESWLMVNFDEDSKLYFKGQNNSLIAYIEIKLFGNASDDMCNKMTEEVTNIISEELGIDKSNIYVSYYPTDKWGWNGNNF